MMDLKLNREEYSDIVVMIELLFDPIWETPKDDIGVLKSLKNRWGINNKTIYKLSDSNYNSKPLNANREELDTLTNMFGSLIKELNTFGRDTTSCEEVNKKIKSSLNNTDTDRFIIEMETL